jgi:predicted nucleic acid-binding protein
MSPTGFTSAIFRSLELEFVTPYKSIDEIWEHETDWGRKRSHAEVSRFVDELDFYVHVMFVNRNSREYLTAESTMKSIDIEDAEFVALALQEHCPTWSRDGHFDKQSLVQNVDHKDIKNLVYSIPTFYMALDDDGFIT